MNEKVKIRRTEEFLKRYRVLLHRGIFLQKGNIYILLTVGGHKLVE